MTVRVFGVMELRSKIRAMAARSDNPLPVWPKVGRYLDNVTDRQFASKGAYLATPWKPLRPNYRTWKVRNGYPPNILIMTGKMKRSFRVLETRRTSVVFGSTDRKTPWHQHGTRMNGKRHVPARPMIKATRGVRRGVRDIVADYIVDGSML